MSRLIDTPSAGQSEVLETLHYQAAIGGGIELVKLGPIVAHRWLADEDREGSDPVFEADLLTVLGQLQAATLIVARDASGSQIDITSGIPGTTRVVLTGLGRAQARHPRPRPRRIDG